MGIQASDAHEEQVVHVFACYSEHHFNRDEVRDSLNILSPFIPICTMVVRCSDAPVRRTEGRLTLGIACFGHLDRSTQTLAMAARLIPAIRLLGKPR